ncbi:serine/threonine protein kinase, putative, partial [Entamoeba invadens IP1]
DDCQVKLTDFGISKHMDESCEDKWYGSAPYMSPEAVLKSMKLTPKSDVWSLGISVIEMREKKPPYEDLMTMRILELIKKHPPPTFKNKEENSEEITNFVASCLVKNPNQRASIKDLKKHRFLQIPDDNQPILNLCVSVYQTRYHYMPQISIFPDNKFAIKYIDKDDENRAASEQIRQCFSSVRHPKQQGESIRHDNSINSYNVNSEVMNEQIRLIEKLQSDILALNEKVLSLQENFALYTKEKMEDKVKELDNYKQLVKEWTKDVVENMVQNMIDDKLHDFLFDGCESSSGDVSPRGVCTPGRNVESNEVSRDSSPKLEEFSPRTRTLKKENKKSFNLSVKVPKDIIGITPRIKTMRKDDMFESLGRGRKKSTSFNGMRHRSDSAEDRWMSSRRRNTRSMHERNSEFGSFKKSLELNYSKAENQTKDKVSLQPLVPSNSLKKKEREPSPVLSNKFTENTPRLESIPILRSTSPKPDNKIVERPIAQRSSSPQLVRKQGLGPQSVTTSQLGPTSVKRLGFDEVAPKSNSVFTSAVTKNKSSVNLSQLEPENTDKDKSVEKNKIPVSMLSSTSLYDKVQKQSPTNSMRGVSSPHSSTSRKDTIRKGPMKQKRFSRQNSKVLGHSAHPSVSKPLDQDTEAKVMSVLRFEVAKARCAICEMVPSNYEILRTELIDEIDRRSKVYKFNNIVGEDVPMKIHQMEEKINELDRKVVDVDIHLSQFRQEIPKSINEFRNELFEALQNL